MSQSDEVRAQSRTAPVLPVAVMTFTGLAVVSLIALAEIDRLVASSASNGLVTHVSDVVGLRFTAPIELWRRWVDPDVVGLVRLHTAVDIVFIFAYALLLRRLLAAMTRELGRGGRSHGTAARGAAIALVGLDVVEDLALFVATFITERLSDTPQWVVITIYAFSTLKWASLAVLVIVLVGVPTRRRFLGDHLRLVARTVKYQRLSAIGLGLLAVLSLVPGPNLLDQLPDVQRRWFSEDPGGTRQFLYALLATTVYAVILFIVGRARSDRARGDFATLEGLRPSRTWPWLGVAGGAGAVAIVLTWLGPDGRGWVDGFQLATFAGTAAGVAVTSWIAACLVRRRWLRVVAFRSQRPVRDDGQRIALNVAVAGDVLAAATFVVGAAGLVRSLTAPVVLRGTEYPSRIIFLVVGIVAVLVVPAAAQVVTWMIARLPGVVGDVLDPGVHHRPRHRALVLSFPLAASLALFVGFALCPASVAPHVGVLATAGFLLGAWTALLGLVIVATQYRRPPALFRVLGLRAVPVLSLLVIVGTVGAWHGGDPDLHRVTAEPPTPAYRQTLDARFAHWLTTSGCEVPVATAGGPVVRVRPLLLIAARGGGARAAWWTAVALEQLGPAGSCAERAALFSSGVSGGSVGLAVGHRELSNANPKSATEKLIEPDALAAATAGLFGADVFGNLTGLRTPSSGVGTDGWAWRDRAALMEQMWGRQAIELAAPMGGDDRGRGGALILNSTDAVSGCRVLVSQLSLPGGRADRRCPQPEVVPAAIDYFGGSTCPAGISWGTAAMLSARFPFVTPAGRTSPCPGRTGRDMQLVDGGYSESSGLGTITELAPSVIDLARAHNATVDAVGGPFVVPIVVDLANGYHGDLTPEPNDLGLEPLIPATARAAAEGLPNDPTTWSLRLSSILRDPCARGAASPCSLAAAALQGRVEGPVVLIAPRTEPEITAPLGWTLSRDSRLSLECDLRPDSRADAGRKLASLAGLLGGRPTPATTDTPVSETLPTSTGAAPLGGPNSDTCPAPVG